MIWTPAMDATLTAGWTNGLSSFQIASLIGSPITASAVRGRRVDLSLPPRGNATLEWAGRLKAARAVDKPLNLPSGGHVPLAEPKSFAERGRWECAFILAEDRDGMLACCGPVRPGARRPYCDFHLDLTGAAHAAA